MGLLAALIIGRLFITVLAGGLGANRSCGWFLPVLASILLSPLLVSLYVGLFTKTKSRAPEFSFLRDKDGKLVPDIDQKTGKQKVDKSNGKPLWVCRVKDEGYYHDREKKFMKFMFVTPLVSSVKYTVLGPYFWPRLALRTGKRLYNRFVPQSALALAVQQSKENGIIHKLSDKALSIYDQAMDSGADVQQGVAVDVVKEETLTVKLKSSYHGYFLPNGEACIICPRAEMAELKVELEKTEFASFSMVSPIQEKDVVFDVLHGSRVGYCFTPDREPQEFGIVLDEGKVCYADERLDRTLFESLKQKAGDVIDSYSSSAGFFAEGEEMQVDGAYTLQTTGNSILLNYSGKPVASLEFDRSDGAVVFDLVEDASLRKSFTELGRVEPSELVSNPRMAMDVFENIVLSEENACVINEKVNASRMAQEAQLSVSSQSYRETSGLKL